MRTIYRYRSKVAEGNEPYIEVEMIKDLCRHWLIHGG